jgi:Protein of unknown function (DUF3307)
MPLWFTLILIYQVKHFVADYPLQGRYMLGKFLPGWGFVLPLLAHVAVHGAFTLAITSFLVGWWCIPLALFDATIHFLMDRAKASKRYLGRFKPLTAETYPTATPAQLKSNTYFWWSLGLDQMIHHLTHYAVIFWVIRHVGR